MAEISYQDLSILVTDDFSSFRSIVNGLLQGLGVFDVDMASNCEGAIERCTNKFYDLILCDYNLGRGRNGQHVLEELRHRGLLTHNNIFIMVSAEAARNIVMSAYDCEPDDYLMKPITARVLQQRIDRLLKQRLAMKPIYKALESGDRYLAKDKLTEMSLAENRYSIAAQKMLGEIFIKDGELDKAERLYTRALEVRQVDWARLGLAKVKQTKGELELAGTWLEKIVDENPLFLPAYDVLADNWDIKGQKINVQSTVQRAVDISPMSILRQKKLSQVANENNDMETAVSALRKTVRLGQLSCHGSAENSIEFARMISKAVEKKHNADTNTPDEALEYLEAAKDRFHLTGEELIQCKLLSGRIHALNGDVSKAKHLLEEARDLIADIKSDVDTDLDYVSTLLSLGEKEKANKLLEELKIKYQDDQEALRKLDGFLNEPVSEENRAMVATINREGIDLYNQNRFDEALECFERARKLFPKHIGIQLNIVQALIGKLKAGNRDSLVVNECQSSLDLVASLIEDDHPQYDRFRQLKKMALIA